MRDRRDNGLLLGANWMHRQHVILWRAGHEVRFEIEILAGCLSRDSRRKRAEELAELHAFVDDTLHSRIRRISQNATGTKRTRPPFGLALHPANDGTTREKPGNMFGKFLVARTRRDRVEAALSNGGIDFRRVERRAEIRRGKTLHARLLGSAVIVACCGADSVTGISGRGMDEEIVTAFADEAAVGQRVQRYAA